MKRHAAAGPGFTLIELSVVIAIIGILAALMLPALSSAKATAKRANCLSDTHQISLAVQLYATDHRDILPDMPDIGWGKLTTNHFLIFYKRLVKQYAGLSGASSTADRVFACPADTFFYDYPVPNRVDQSLHDQIDSDYSSYGFLGGGNAPNQPKPPAFLNQTSYGGVGGLKLATIKDPARTVMVMELSAGFPWSWHQPQPIPAGQFGFNDARNVISFCDGHVGYIKMYRNPGLNLPACNYEPPAGYDYKWHAD